MKLYIKDGIIRPANRIQVKKEIKGKTFVIYGPNESIILSDGWKIYTPPVTESVNISTEEQYKNRIIELVREEYSVDDELAILRQRDTKIDEFNSYNTFVEECKVTARREIYGDELV